jgi:YD repeat-containing protein
LAAEYRLPRARGGLRAPASICGAAVSYDANGNTLSYDVDSTAGPEPVKSFTYDAENRPLSVTKAGSGITSTYTYDALGERAGKSSTAPGNPSTIYLGNDVEVLIDPANGITAPGQMTAYLTPDAMREGSVTKWLHKDHLASNQLVTGQAGAVSSLILPATITPDVSYCRRLPRVAASLLGVLHSGVHSLRSAMKSNGAGCTLFRRFTPGLIDLLHSRRERQSEFYCLMAVG